jgi:hypothetical protein
MVRKRGEQVLGSVARVGHHKRFEVHYLDMIFQLILALLG